MELILDYIVEGVTGFVVFQGQLCYCNDSHELIVNNKSYLSDADGNNMFVLMEDLLQVWSRDQGSYLYKDGGIVSNDYFISSRGVGEVVLARSSSYVLNKYDFKWDILLLSKDLVTVDKVLLTGVTYNLIHYNDSLFVVSDGYNIKGYNISTSQLLWSISLVQYLEDERHYIDGRKVVLSLCVFSQGMLIIGCILGLIVAIDVTKGKVLKKWQYFNTDIDRLNRFGMAKLPPSSLFRLSLDGNSLYAFNHLYLYVIMLGKNDVIVVDLGSELLKHGIDYFKGIGKAAESSSYYFVPVDMIKSKGSEVVMQGIVVVNKKSLKVESVFTSENLYLGKNHPVIFNDRLYIQDGKNNILVFSLSYSV